MSASAPASSSGGGSSLQGTIQEHWEAFKNDPSQYYGIILTIIGVIIVRILVRKYVLHVYSPQPANASGTLKQINVYPIKSCKGLSVSKWKINKYGLEHDRE